jgi:hypothetical protein
MNFAAVHADMADFKIYGGTAKGNVSLCDSCLFGQVRQGYLHSQRVVVCFIARHTKAAVVEWPVAECMDYRHRGESTKEEMEKTATILDGSHTRVRGFKG